MKKVKIKNDISNCHDVVPEMLKFQGLTVTVKEEWKDKFFIEEDGMGWSWYTDMIEKVINE